MSHRLRASRPLHSRLFAAALFVAAPLAAQLGPTGSQFWYAGSDGLDSVPQEGARFGHATAAGDFDGDGYEDLAVASPDAEVGGAAGAGEVLVLYGGEGGLGATGHQVWSQDSPDVPGGAFVGDAFGRAVAAGDFDADGYDDLVVGVPLDSLGAAAGAGSIHVLRGSALGITLEGTRFYNPGSVLIPDDAESGDRFGAALAVGDFDADGFADLAVGSPGEDVEGVTPWTDLGALHLFFGSAAGLQASGSLFFRPGEGVVASPPPADGISFGAALAAGAVLGNGRDQVAIGIPRLDVDGAVGAGGIVVLDDPGAGGVLLGLVTQSTAGVPGVAEAGDNFGAALATGHFSGDATADVAVGAPGESVDGDGGAGAVVTLRRPFTPDFVAELWTQDDLSPFTAEPNDRFGAELEVGDFDADGRDDLVVGHPGEAIGGTADFGGAAILFGTDAGVDAAGFQGLPLGAWLVEELELGFALAAGRFSGHSGDDLAISLPLGSTEVESGAGAVVVYASLVLFVDGFEAGDTSAWGVGE